MGEKRKLYEQARKDLAALDRVYQLCNGGVNSTHTEIQEKLEGVVSTIGPDISEAQREFERAKRRYQIAYELFNDCFFDCYVRDVLETARDISFSELAARKKVWNDL